MAAVRTQSSAWRAKDGTLIGAYSVHFEDKTKVEAPIVYGEHTRDWFYIDDEKETSLPKWRGLARTSNSTSVRSMIRVYLMTRENPKPAKKIATINYSSKKEEAVAAPFCIGDYGGSISGPAEHKERLVEHASIFGVCIRAVFGQPSCASSGAPPKPLLPIFSDHAIAWRFPV